MSWQHGSFKFSKIKIRLLSGTWAEMKRHRNSSTTQYITITSKRDDACRQFWYANVEMWWMLCWRVDTSLMHLWGDFSALFGCLLMCNWWNWSVDYDNLQTAIKRGLPMTSYHGGGGTFIAMVLCQNNLQFLWKWLPHQSRPSILAETKTVVGYFIHSRSNYCFFRSRADR